MSAPATMAFSAACACVSVAAIAPIPSESVMTSPSKPSVPRSSPVMAAFDRLAGSSGAVSPGTSAWVTMIAGAPALIACWNGMRSFARSSSIPSRVVNFWCGSAPPPPMPGQCLTTGTIPASLIAGKTALTKVETFVGSSP